MLLAETRTITNTSQAKQVTWEEVVAEFAGRVRRVTDIQWSVLSVGVQRLKEKVANPVNYDTGDDAPCRAQ